MKKSFFAHYLAIYSIFLTFQAQNGFLLFLQPSCSQRCQYVKRDQHVCQSLCKPGCSLPKGGSFPRIVILWEVFIFSDGSCRIVAGSHGVIDLADVPAVADGDGIFAHVAEGIHGCEGSAEAVCCEICLSWNAGSLHRRSRQRSRFWLFLPDRQSSPGSYALR